MSKPRISAIARVLDHIVSEMDAGTLGPGMRVNAAKISAHLGLSVTPVREALGQLAGRGVIELLPDRGAVIRSMSAEEAKKMWDVMTALCSVGTELAVEAILRGADTTELLRCYSRIVDEPLSGPPVSFYLKTNAYHKELHRIGGNEYVQDLADRAGLAFWVRFLAKYIDIVSNLSGYRMNYRRYHEAIMAGDGPSAVAAFRYHARWSVALINEMQASEPPRRRRRRRTEE